MTAKMVPGTDMVSSSCMNLGLLVETLGDLGEAEAQFTEDEIRTCWEIGDAAADLCEVVSQERCTRSGFTAVLRSYRDWWKQPGIEVADAVESLALVLATLRKASRADPAKQRKLARCLISLLDADGRMTKAEWELLPWVLGGLGIPADELRKAMLE